MRSRERGASPDVDDCVAAAAGSPTRAWPIPGCWRSAAGAPAGSPPWPRWRSTTRSGPAAAATGVADLGALATDTHKFESRYLDSLVGPWPEAKATYDERSRAIQHVDGFDEPLLVLQGDEDEVALPPPSPR